MRTKKLKYCFELRQCGPVARNTAAKNATGDILFFMDAHTTLGKDSVEPLADYLIDHPECGCISGLTAWSHYTSWQLGTYYQLFHPEEKMKTGKGGPSLPTHMHGHYMALGRIPKDKRSKPFEIVMGSQAYTMYRKDEFLKRGGYCDDARFYPHPEGLLPFLVGMTGQSVMVHPKSWHIHGMFPRKYSLNPAETKRKIDEYGGYSWHEHGIRNVLMVAYIVGGLKWLKICYNAIMYKSYPRRLPELRASAIETVDESERREMLLKQQEMTLDELLTRARKEHIPGMETWFKPIGKDPL